MKYKKTHLTWLQGKEYVRTYCGLKIPIILDRLESITVSRTVFNRLRKSKSSSACKSCLRWNPYSPFLGGIKCGEGER